MPTVAWNAENMRYVMCFFPLVGVFVALFQAGWFFLCTQLSLSALLLGVGMAAIPIAVTGGIHLDGLLDTFDALASHQSKERKLEILKDSHTGAFAIIGFGLYFAFYVALAANLTYNGNTFLLLGGVYLLERCLSGLSVASFPCAKNSGLVYAFSDGAAKKTVRIFLVVFALGVAAGMLMISPFALSLLGVSLLVFLYYYGMSMRQFGGITGDLAGYFLQLCEIFLLLTLLLLQKTGVMG